MNQKVSVGMSDIGRGVFARSLLREGELILFFTGKYLSRQANDALGEDGNNSIQVEPEAYIYPRAPNVYLNHSCDPNAGITPELKLVSLRDIDPGEEIRFDYSTTMLEKNWVMHCQCADADCRGVIGDFDDLPAGLQEYYIDRGVVQSFILEQIFGTVTAGAIPAA